MANLFQRIFGAPKRNQEPVVSEPIKEPDFASFWHGPVDGITYGCLASFPYHGLLLRLYTYDSAPNVPPGIQIADAREICADETLVGRYIAEGKVESAKFANLFRYLLLQKTGICWIDTDFLCLRKPDFLHDASIFGRQFPAGHSWTINNAVLKLPPDSSALAQLIDGARTVVDLDQRWGIIGPELVTSVIEGAGLSELAHPIVDFYPFPPDEFWMPLLPQERGRVDAGVAHSSLLHLWHNNYKRSGYDKNVAPPKGSFLYEAFSQVSGLGGFSRTYDVDELKNQLGSWLPEEKAWPNDYAHAQVSKMRDEIVHLQQTTTFLMEFLSSEPTDGLDDKVRSATWKWGNGSAVAFGSDGIVYSDGRRDGVWRRLMNQPTTVVVTWDYGGWIDIVESEEDGKLKCRNNLGGTFIAFPITEK